MCSMVDFPHPDGPMMATDSPGATLNVSPLTATVDCDPSR